MSIISVTMLDDELPADAANTNGEETDAVAQATAFVNTWTSRHYDPFDDYTLDATSPSIEVVNAPAIIHRICLEVAKAYYWLRVGQVYRDGEEKQSWGDYLDRQKESLQTIAIAPEWKSQTISLNSNLAMVIGARSSLGFWPRVVPQTAQVVSASTNVWVPPDDWYIQMGGAMSEDEYPDAWYFYGGTSSVEGTLRYMRTYRNDGYDYARYQDA